MYAVVDFGKESMVGGIDMVQLRRPGHNLISLHRPSNTVLADFIALLLQSPRDTRAAVGAHGACACP